MYLATPPQVIIARSADSSQPTSEYIDYTSTCLGKSYTIREDYTRLVLISRDTSGEKIEVDLSDSDFSKAYYSANTTYVGRFIFHCNKTVLKSSKMSIFGFVFYGYKIGANSSSPTLVAGSMDFDGTMNTVSSTPLAPYPYKQLNLFGNYRDDRGRGMVTKPVN